MMVERSPLSRNLALMRAKGWITNAASDWRRSQAQIETTLDPTARSTLDHWIDTLDATSPEEAAATPTPDA